MYDLKCDEKFNSKLDISNVSLRYLSVTNTNKKNIIIIKEQFDDPTFRYRGYNIVQTMKNHQQYNFNYLIIKSQ